MSGIMLASNDFYQRNVLAQSLHSAFEKLAELQFIKITIRKNIQCLLKKGRKKIYPVYKTRGLETSQFAAFTKSVRNKSLVRS